MEGLEDAMSALRLWPDELISAKSLQVVNSRFKDSLSMMIEQCIKYRMALAHRY